MKNYNLQRSGGSCPVNLPGDDLADAITGGWDTIAKEAGLGNAAGYKLHSAIAEYAPGIIGGKGGCRLTIKASGLPLAHRPHDSYPSKTYEIWIDCTEEDIPNAINITII